MSIRNQFMYWVLWAFILAGVMYLFGIEGNNEEAAIQGRSSVGWMIGRWECAGADMSHGWLIPLVSLYMVWSKRVELRDVAKCLSWGGLGIVLFALALYLVGLRVQQTRFVLISLVVLIWGISFFLCGWKSARFLVFPCAYLVFCIPMTFLDSLTFPLRLVSSAVSETLLNGLGIAVTRLGTAMHIHAGGGFSLDVAHPCSGLRYLLAMVALTTAYAYFSQVSLMKRMILSVSAIPLAMAGNIARISLIAIVGIVFGENVALGFYHDYSGYVVFGVATLLMLGIGSFLHRPWPTSLQKKAILMNEDVEYVRKRMRSLVFGACILLVMFGLTAFLACRIRAVDVAASNTADLRQELPEQVGNWRGEPIYYCQREQCMKSFLVNELSGSRTCPLCGGTLDQVSLGERNILPLDTIISRRLYHNEQGEIITVTIVLSGSEQRSIHRPQQCLPAQGYAIEQSSVLTVPLEGRNPLKLTMIRARMEAVMAGKVSPRLLMVYWFAGGGHETHDHLRRMVFMAWDNLIHGIRSRWAYVSLQTTSSADTRGSERRLADFVHQLYPHLKPASR